MGYKHAHAPVYGYMKGYKHTIPLHLVHYARTFSIFKLLNKIQLGKVINVGGADGYQSYLIQKIFGVDVVTMDIDKAALEIAANKYGLTTRHGSALNIPFADNYFDTAICIETIEHIDKPHKVVSELKRVARSNVIISTESFFDSETQKKSFLEYIHETHPQFFRASDPVKPGDVSHFTSDDFIHLFESSDLDFHPQFSSKQAEIIGDIDEIRAHVQAMTENLNVSKQTKVIVHFHKNHLLQNAEPVPEERILQEIVRDTPLFEMDLDRDMIQEDADNVTRITTWHEEKQFCSVMDSSRSPALPIEEEGAKGMSLQWITKDNLEKSPQFCVRKVTLEPSGHTPARKTAWEHQMYVLSGAGRLIEDKRETEIHPGKTILVPGNIAFKIENTGNDALVYLDIIPSITHYFGR